MCHFYKFPVADHMYIYVRNWLQTEVHRKCFDLRNIIRIFCWVVSTGLAMMPSWIFSLVNMNSGVYSTQFHYCCFIKYIRFTCYIFLNSSDYVLFDMTKILWHFWIAFGFGLEFDFFVDVKLILWKKKISNCVIAITSQLVMHRKIKYRMQLCL